ncbi:MAG: carboxypeptidase-like regulatory domain-containing protein, partial [Flavobacteriaceae bacterium]
MSFTTNLTIQLTLFFLTGLFSLLQAQTIEIKGLVKDSINQPLSYANVFAEPIDKNIKVSYAVTDEKGHYSLRIKKKKPYKVTCSYIGFVNKDVAFNFSKDTIYNFKLKEDLNQLDEINISYTIPIVVKTDTITYNTDKFVTGNERKLKDVLKKLPGIEVDRNGNVTANGKKVSSLLVEDKPFFGGNTKLGVNNIPADAIDKVQILENYSDVAMLKNLQDDDKVALNIKLKEDKKKFVFGDLETGTGIKEKYLLHPKLFYYSPKTSVNFIGDVTNTGEKSFTIRDYIEFEGGAIKMLNNAGGFMKLYRSDFAKYLSNQDYKADKTIFGAFNVRRSISKSTDLSLYVISAKSNTLSENKNNNQYLFGDLFIENRIDTNEKDNFYTIGKLTLDYNPNKKTDYIFSSILNISDSENLSNINTNSQNEILSIKNKSNLDVFSFKQQISLNNKLSKKHTVTFDANYNYQKDKPNMQWNTNQEILEGLIPIIQEDYFRVRQVKHIKSQEISALLKDYWVLHRFHHIYTSFGVNKSNTSLFNNDYQILANNTINNFNTADFGNDFKHHFLDTYIGLEYKFKTGKTTFKPAIYYHNYHWSVHQLNTAKKRFTKKMFLPQLNVKVSFKNSEKLNFKYQLNNQFVSTKSL